MALPVSSHIVPALVAHEEGTGWEEDEYRELNNFFNQRCMDAVQKCIRSALEHMKRAIFPQL